MTHHLHADDNVYDSLAEAEGGGDRWAFGAGFTDPLAGIDQSVPDGVDAGALALSCLGLADDALVLSQRLALWVSNAPELEDEVALANVALDLLGQARMLLTRAAQADAALRPSAAPAHVPDEDALAYWRKADRYTNVRLAELDDELDFARCIARLLVLTTWRLAELDQLARDAVEAGAEADHVLSAIAAKAVVELTYHREYAAGWLVRLGDGTDESHHRSQAALEWLWPYLAELIDGSAAPVRAEVDGVLDQVLAAATLRRPSVDAAAGSGRAGDHTAHLTALLDDLQDFARANPDATW